MKYNDGDLIYVTGDSGSGKSTFLKIFQEHEQLRGRKCVNFDNIHPEPTEVLVDNLGENQHEAMKILGTVGLSEAFLMVRQYRELSDGQKYRYRLGKAIDTEADTYLIDEFGAKLDREMAKTLAFCIQKWARRNKKTFVIATTHRDLKQDFNADIIYDRRFGEQTKPKYFKPTSPPRFSLIREMKIEPAAKEDYDKLKQFHYLHGRPPTSHSYKLAHNNQVIGIILYGPPFLGSHYRNQMFPEYKHNAKKVNSDITRISRIIIHPKYRGCGLAQELIRLTMPMIKKRIVETIAAMAQYNPFFEKAGMTYVGKQKFTSTQQKFVNFVEKQGANIGLLQDHNFRKGFLNSLTAQQINQLLKILEKIVHSMKGVSQGRYKSLQQQLEKGDIEKMMSKTLPVERVYLYWLNPQWQA
jgi:ABC-type lipoprotein export system ATPase subunit/GNAT superfamily N-acetyltransferase